MPETNQTTGNISPIYISAESAMAGKPWDPAQAKAWLKYAKNAGGEKSNFYKNWVAALKQRGIPESKALQAWSDAVDYTQVPGNASQGAPETYLNIIDPGAYISASKEKYGTTKQQQKYVTEYSTSSAAADLQQMFRSEVGRKATAEEVAAYQKQANAMAAKEPSVTTAITTTSPGMSTTTGSTQTGFNPTEFAREFAQSVPDYAENFAVSNFVKLIDQALSDPNRIGQVVQ